MYTRVPKYFVTYFKMVRIAMLLVAIAVVVSLSAILTNPNLMVVTGVPIAAMLMILMRSRGVIFYHFDAGGVSFSLKSDADNFTGLFGISSRRWIYWENDAFVKVTVSHWKQRPALLIKTKNKPKGYIIPVLREEVEEVLQFVSSIK